MSQAKTQTRNAETKKTASRSNSRMSTTSPYAKKDTSAILQDIESRYPDVKGKNLKKLRDMKKNAIEKFDFDQSDAIQTYINILDQDNLTGLVKGCNQRSHWQL